MHLYESIHPFRHIHIDAGLIWRILLLLALLLAAPFLAGCRNHGSSLQASTGDVITLSSASLQDGNVPKDFTCDGEDQSPVLSWQLPPDNAKALALIVTDPDAGQGTFTHWVIYNLPANTSGLSAGVPKQAQLANGSRQGKTDFDKVGYGGPCPPPGPPHRYVFTLYALDSELDVPAGAPRSLVESAMRGHILAKGELIARYRR
jgi:Raf kinase inhibitor-like YbhB/YbcL family protein